MSFYVTLLSDDTENGQQSNVQNNFTTTLSPQIQLQGNWEVALTEMTCSNGHNIDLGTMTIGTNILPLIYHDGMTIYDFAYHLNVLFREVEIEVEGHSFAKLRRDHALTGLANDLSPKFLETIRTMNHRLKFQVVRIKNDVYITYGSHITRSKDLYARLHEIEIVKYEPYMVQIHQYETYAYIQLRIHEIDKSTVTDEEQALVLKKVQYSKDASDPYILHEVKRIVAESRYQKDLYALLDNIEAYKITDGSFPLKVDKREDRYDIYQSDYDNWMHNFAEVKNDQILIRRFTNDNIIFEGLVGMIMNKDPLNPI
jgi:hypothetical protein